MVAVAPTLNPSITTGATDGGAAATTTTESVDASASVPGTLTDSVPWSPGSEDPAAVIPTTCTLEPSTATPEGCFDQTALNFIPESVDGSGAHTWQTGATSTSTG